MKKIVLKGSVTVYVMILVGMIIGFYLFGFTSLMGSVITKGFASENEQQPEAQAGEIVSGIVDSIKDNWAIFGIVVGGSILISLFTGGSSIASFLSVFLPLFILLFISNLFFFPVVSQSPAIGLGPIGTIMALVFNVLMMLTVVEFISGRN